MHKFQIKKEKIDELKLFFYIALFLKNLDSESDTRSSWWKRRQSRL